MSISPGSLKPISTERPPETHTHCSREHACPPWRQEHSGQSQEEPRKPMKKSRREGPRTWSGCPVARPEESEDGREGKEKERQEVKGREQTQRVRDNERRVRTARQEGSLKQGREERGEAVSISGHSPSFSQTNVLGKRASSELTLSDDPDPEAPTMTAPTQTARCNRNAT